MSWQMEGAYIENCNCDAPCPCTWSWLTWPATHDRCNALLAYHIDQGSIDGVDVSDLSFAIVLDAPPMMGEGNWRPRGQTGSSTRCGLAGSSTWIRSPGRTTPPVMTTLITPALRTMLPSASRSSVAAISPG